MNENASNIDIPLMNVQTWDDPNEDERLRQQQIQQQQQQQLKHLTANQKASVKVATHNDCCSFRLRAYPLPNEGMSLY